MTHKRSEPEECEFDSKKENTHNSREKFESSCSFDSRKESENSGSSNMNRRGGNNVVILV